MKRLLLASALLVTSTGHAGAPAPMMQIELPDGEVAPGEPLVVRGYPGPGAYQPRVLVDGKPVAVEVRMWRDLAPDPGQQSWFLLDPKGGWPKGGKKITVKAQYLQDLEAKLGQTPDKTPPAIPRFGVAQTVTQDYPMYGSRTFVQLPYEKLDDRSPILHLTLRLEARGIVRTRTIEVTTVLLPNAPGMIVLPEGSPTCVAGGMLVDPAGNSTPLPPSPCSTAVRKPSP